ncbi:MAG: hypothetical protein ACE5D7_00275 [Fidelibacterota bacterium]
METIYTRQLIDEGHTPHPHAIIVDPVNIDQTISTLKSIREKTVKIEIFDYSPPQKPTGRILSVNDHVNRSGINPLVGRQKLLDVEFIDLTGMYVKKKGGITTICCGNHPIPENTLYPSMYLSTVSILAKAMDYKEIHAYIVC